MDDHDYRRAPGSRVAVLFVGLLIGAAIMTAVWAAIAGNPLSDANEVVFREVLVDSVAEDRLCWADDPTRRDTAQQCAILTLDPKQDPPSAGDAVLIGVTALRPARGEQRLQVVYAAPADAPTEAPSDAASEPPG